MLSRIIVHRAVSSRGRSLAHEHGFCPSVCLQPLSHVLERLQHCRRLHTRTAYHGVGLSRGRGKSEMALGVMRLPIAARRSTLAPHPPQSDVQGRGGAFAALRRPCDRPCDTLRHRRLLANRHVRYVCFARGRGTRGPEARSRAASVSAWLQGSAQVHEGGLLGLVGERLTASDEGQKRSIASMALRRQFATKQITC